MWLSGKIKIFSVPYFIFKEEIMGRTVTFALFGISLALNAGFALSAQLKVSSFNIRFYGNSLSEDSDKVKDGRDSYIKDFLTKENILTSDVIVFEEIVDKEALVGNVLGNEFNCTSYDVRNAGHQHVMVCHKPEYKFEKAADDDNFILEDVTLGKNLRPAVHGLLKNQKGQTLAHLVGVHLKAMPNESSTRERQMQVIAGYLNKQDKNTPIIMTGDFNSFEDDADNFTKILNLKGNDMAEVENPSPYTFQDGKYRNKLDRIWASDEVKVISKIEVKGPCNNRSPGEGSGYGNVAYYNKNISDHCPITAVVEVP